MEKKLLKRFTWVVMGVLLVEYCGPGGAESQVLGTRQKLPNDLVWLFSAQTDLPLVTLELLIKAGTLTDPPGKEGLANLTASLLRKRHQIPLLGPDCRRAGFYRSAPCSRRGR